MTQRDSDYYTRVRDLTRQVWNGINDLAAEQRQYNALDYGTNLPAGDGVNSGITKTEIGAVVFDTTNAMITLLNTGHATNMAKLL